METVLGELIDHPSAGDVPYFGLGDVVPEGMDRLVDGLKMFNALQGDTAWRSLVNQSFLPEDLRRPL